MLIYNVVFQAYSKLIQLYIYNFMYTTYIGEAGPLGEVSSGGFSGEASGGRDPRK